MSETEIIQSILSGNRNVYAHLIEKYQAMVFRTCMGFAHNKDDADDLTQEVFVNAYQALPKFKRESAFSTWLYRIAVNISLNHVRNSTKWNIFQRMDGIRSSEKRKENINIAIDFTNPEQILIEEEHRTFVKKMLGSLPKNQRTALVLSKYDELSQKEIAEIMNTTEGAVEALIQRAKANLRKKLKNT
jgi:RNA polymerase sigma-70 factor (ECF subfamily)